MRFRLFCTQTYMVFFALVLKSYSAPVSTPSKSLVSRQNSPDERVCEYLDPSDYMANVDDAWGAADYLSSLSGVDCRHDRDGGTYNTFIQWGSAEVNIYFTDRNPQVIWASYDCGYIANYLRELIDACQTNGKVQGRRMIPNCPNKGVAYYDTVPDNDGGSAIEIVPVGYHNWK